VVEARVMDRSELSLTEYVLEIVHGQLDELERWPPQAT
jgi:hypothetical protein